MFFAFASRAMLGIVLSTVWLATALAATAPGKTNAMEIVGFPSWQAAPDDESPRLSGRIMRPDGQGPFPAVVMLHGCSGLYTKAGALRARHLWWARTLREQGYLVLLIDSFGPRSIGDQCSETDRKVHASAERKRDAWGALDFLRARSDVLKERIAVLGWSQGGGAALATLDRGGPEPGFRGAVAFYPGCQTSLNNPDWQPKSPLLILIGEKDDWTPVAPCEELTKRSADKDQLELVIYPGAYHGFDLLSMPVAKRTGHATGDVHVGTDETARADAVERVTAFLTKHLKD